MKIALIADSHLSARAPECERNWHAAAQAAAAADLSIHLGDISLDGERRHDELPYAAQRVRDWPTPMLCVPGNHDIGTGSGEQPLSPAARARYRAAFGEDRWVRRVGDWALVGLDAQLLGSASTDEAELLCWLEAEPAIAEAGHVALFLHRPLGRPPLDMGMPRGRYVPEAAARRLRQGRLLRSRLRLAASGHTHQSLDFIADGVRIVWVPSCAFVISDAQQAPIGSKRVGFGWLTLGDGGAFRCSVLSTPQMRAYELGMLRCHAELAAAHD